MSDDLSKSVHVRLPPDLLERLRADAEANGRTVAQTIRFLLGRAFDGS